MKKSVNLTIRIDEELKRQAETACAYLDKTLSDVLRSTLRDIVRQYHKTRSQDTYYQRIFMEGDLAEAAQAALAREVEREQRSQGKKRDEPISLNELIRDRPPKEPYQPSPKPTGEPRFNENGRLDPATMPRNMRRSYQRDLARGTFNVQPTDKYKSNQSVSVLDPEQRLRELLDKEKKGHLTRQEREQKNALLKALR